MKTFDSTCVEAVETKGLGWFAALLIAGVLLSLLPILFD
jgi:hypothetical protein